jgi:hypothetical protein
MDEYAQRSSWKRIRLTTFWWLAVSNCARNRNWKMLSIARQRRPVERSPEAVATSSVKKSLYQDPNGFTHEFFFGHAEAGLNDVFHSTMLKVVSSPANWATGHILPFTRTARRPVKFYTDVLKLRVSDYIRQRCSLAWWSTPTRLHRHRPPSLHCHRSLDAAEGAEPFHGAGPEHGRRWHGLRPLRQGGCPDHS